MKKAAVVVLLLMLSAPTFAGDPSLAPAAGPTGCDVDALDAARTELHRRLGVPDDLDAKSRVTAAQRRELAAGYRGFIARCPDNEPGLLLETFIVLNVPAIPAAERLAAAEAASAAYAARRGKLFQAWPGSVMVAQRMVESGLDPARTLAVLEGGRQDFEVYAKKAAEPGPGGAAMSSRGRLTAALLPVLEARLRLRLGETEKARALLATGYALAADLHLSAGPLSTHYAAARGELLAAAPGGEAPPELAVEAPREAGKFEPADFAFEGWPIADVAGRQWRLEDLAGKTWVVNLWAVWCAPCVAELPQFQKLYDELKERPDVGVLTFNFDSQEKRVQTFLDRNGYTFPVLIAGQRLDNYADDGLPQTWLVDPKGRVRRRSFGFDPAHQDELAASIKAALAQIATPPAAPAGGANSL